MKKSTRKQVGHASLLLFIIYICILVYFVFFSDRYGRGTRFIEYRYNFKPFAEIHRYVTYNEHFTMENIITNLIGNVLVFVPVGFLVPIIKKEGVNVFTILRISFCMTLFIEVIQLAFRIGVFDVDDLIMNTAGGILGYVIFKMTQRWYRRLYLYKVRKNRR